MIKQGTILLADYDQIIRESIEILLEDTGCNIITAKNGEEAVELAVSQKPDIIYLHYGMPKMDGLEAFLEIRKYPELKKTPIIIASASADRLEKVKEFKTGAEYCVQMPFDAREFLQKVKELLQNKIS